MALAPLDANASVTTFASCANEGGTCRIDVQPNTLVYIRYGSDTHFHTYVASNNGARTIDFPCGNSMGDPHPGSAKNCRYTTAPVVPSPPIYRGTGSTGWTFCTSEGGSCNPAGSSGAYTMRWVAYHPKDQTGTVFYKLYSNPFVCANEHIGWELEEKVKACSVGPELTSTVVSTFESCAAESTNCQLGAASQDVVFSYGKVGYNLWHRFSHASDSNLPCGGNIFNYDPAPNQLKNCFAMAMPTTTDSTRSVRATGSWEKVGAVAMGKQVVNTITTGTTVQDSSTTSDEIGASLAIAVEASGQVGGTGPKVTTTASASWARTNAQTIANSTSSSSAVSASCEASQLRNIAMWKFVLRASSCTSNGQCQLYLTYTAPDWACTYDDTAAVPQCVPGKCADGDLQCRTCKE